MPGAKPVPVVVVADLTTSVKEDRRKRGSRGVSDKRCVLVSLDSLPWIWKVVSGRVPRVERLTFEGHRALRPTLGPGGRLGGEQTTGATERGSA